MIFDKLFYFSTFSVRQLGVKKIQLKASVTSNFTVRVMIDAKKFLRITSVLKQLFPKITVEKFCYRITQVKCF